jgi:hypothetical protein
VAGSFGKQCVVVWSLLQTSGTNRRRLYSALQREELCSLATGVPQTIEPLPNTYSLPYVPNKIVCFLILVYRIVVCLTYCLHHLTVKEFECPYMIRASNLKQSQWSYILYTRVPVLANFSFHTKAFGVMTGSCQPSSHPQTLDGCTQCMGASSLCSAISGAGLWIRIGLIEVRRCLPTARVDVKVVVKATASQLQWSVPSWHACYNLQGKARRL